MKIVSIKTLALLLTLSNTAFAGVPGEEGVRDQQPVPGMEQPADDSSVEATQAEERSLQAIHLSNLTQIAVQLMAIGRLPDFASKKAALDLVRQYAQWEIELVSLARKFDINVISREDDIVAIKKKNQEMLKELAQMPQESFEASYNEQVQAEQSALTDFLRQETQLGFNHSEVMDYVNKIITTIQPDSAEGTTNE